MYRKVVCIDLARSRTVYCTSNHEYTESVDETPNFVPNFDDFVHRPDGSFQHRGDSSFGSQPAFVVVGRHGTVLNIHLLDRPRKFHFKESTCFDAIRDRAGLYEMAFDSQESHVAFDTMMDVNEVKRDGRWGSNRAAKVTDAYIRWTAREIVAYATFLDAPSIVFKVYGEIASDNLDRIIAAITRIQNEP